MDKKSPSSPSSDDRTVSFRPVTEGLGFHPFSDGLPYAPMGKNPKSDMALKPMSTSGTGAIAAGPPRPVLPKVLPKAPTFPTTSLGEMRGAKETLGFPPSRVPRISVPIAKKEGAGLSAQPPKLILKKGSKGMAYVATRSMAYLFDISFNSLLMGGILIGLVWQGDIQLDLFLDYGVSTGTAVFFLISSWGLIALQEVFFRSSLGKYLFQLRLDGSRLRIVLRALLFPFSVGVFSLGIVWGLLHERRSCWHDILSGIQPFENDKY